MSSSSNTAKRRRADKKADNLKIEENKDKMEHLNYILHHKRHLEARDFEYSENA